MWTVGKVLGNSFVRFSELTRLRMALVFATLLIATPFFLASAANAKSTTLHIVTPAWKNFTEENGDGFYFDLMRLVYEPQDIAISFDIIPWARSEQLVLKNQADALVGSYREKTDQYHYPKYPMWLDVSAAVFKRDRVKWRGSDSLANKKVGWIRGYRYDNYLGSELDIVRVNKNTQGWAMLRVDRIDFYIDSLTDIDIFMEEQDFSKDEFSVEAVIVEAMFVRFPKTGKGQRLADLYDRKIVTLIENGKLEALFNKWGYEDYFTRFQNSFVQVPQEVDSR